LARQTRPGAVDNPSPIEDEVFAGKRYYSLTMNMPNLTSASGSWVMRFAELHPTPVRGDLTAPVATAKVDPAYPAELMRSGVEGTVVLYAVIRSDGSVGSVRVLRGFDSQLDENARIALSRWHFRPATKNGEAVDLEAVVQIPFRGHTY
jgi:TonB family protein